MYFLITPHLCVLLQGGNIKLCRNKPKDSLVAEGNMGKRYPEFDPEDEERMRTGHDAADGKKSKSKKKTKTKKKKEKKKKIESSSEQSESEEEEVYQTWPTTCMPQEVIDKIVKVRYSALTHLQSHQKKAGIIAARPECKEGTLFVFVLT